MCDCASTQNDCGCGESIELPFIEGQPGSDGQSAYQLWLQAGNTGTLADFLASLEGEDGLSAYEVAVANGFVGTQAQWLASLEGDDGDPGDDGADGVSAFSALSAPFEQPAIGGLVTATLLNASWIVLGAPVHLGGTPGNWYIAASNPIGNQIILRNPGAADGYSAGIAQNSAPGTIIPSGTTIGARGRDGLNSTVPGPSTPPIEVDIPVVDLMPTGEPALGLYTQMLRDTSVTPNTFSIIRWNGTTWQNLGLISGSPGTSVLNLNADPNTMPSSYGAIGDVVIRTDVANEVRWYRKTAPTTWALFATVTGGSVAAIQDMFRVGKSLAQPIPIGSTDPTTIQFERFDDGSYYNGGWWVGSSYAPQVGISTPMRFVLENLRLYADAPETIDFSVDILVKAVSEASITLSAVAADEVELPVLATASMATTFDSRASVTITPLSAPTAQWYIDFTNLAFYNQRIQ